MKITSKLTSAVLGLVLSLGLSSCDKENLSPNKPAGVSSEANRSLSADNTVPKKYTLTQQGGITLLYNHDGSLARTSASTDYTAYTYPTGFGSNSVTSRMYVSGVVREQNTYWLDVSGRCTQKREMTYDEQGSLTGDETYKYEYSAYGQLKKSYNRDRVNERIVYTYDAEGNLIKATYYNLNNVKVTEISYDYQFNYGLKIADKYPLVPRFMRYGWFTSYQYARFFGKFNKHLVRRVTFRNTVDNLVLYDISFQYTLNADGYVIERKAYDLTNNNHQFETTPYHYLVTPLTANN